MAQLKDRHGMEVHFTKHINRLNQEIIPLLFIPFVENAFKHSLIEDSEDSFKAQLTIHDE